MKKSIIAVLAVVFGVAAVFAEGMDLNYVVTQDTSKYFKNSDTAEHSIIQDGTIITPLNTSNIFFVSEIPGVKTILIKNKTNEKFYIPVYYVKPQTSIDLFSENLITHNSCKRIRNLIPDYYCTLLNLKEIEKLKDYEKYFNKNYVNSEIGKFSAEGVTNNLSNCGIYFFSDNYIAFKNIVKKSNKLYECEGAASGDWDPYTTDLDCFRWSSLLKDTPENETEKFLFETDGDYLTISYASDNKHIITLVYVSDSTMDELEHLFRTNTCDLSKVTWPRHADGTCDYDNSKSTAKTASVNQPAPATTSAPTTNVAVKKLMTSNCNLKLRAAEATSSNVLTVMAQGTKVKILELGKAETIDGISSAWVKVEVQAGAKDRDGKPIKAGLVGWAYGGYLE